MIFDGGSSADGTVVGTVVACAGAVAGAAVVAIATVSDAADGSSSGSFTGDVQGSPVNISGTMTLKPVASGAEHTVTIDVAVKIPLIGGKIADWAGKNDVRQTLEAEFAFNDARLTAS